MTTREEAILWLNSFVENKEPMTLIPKQLIRLMHEALTEQPEIVRCKDCEMNNQCSIQFKFADAENPGDWFCAYGKRKSEQKQVTGVQLNSDGTWTEEKFDEYAERFGIDFDYPNLLPRPDLFFHGD